MSNLRLINETTITSSQSVTNITDVNNVIVRLNGSIIPSSFILGNGSLTATVTLVEGNNTIVVEANECDGASSTVTVASSDKYLSHFFKFSTIERASFSITYHLNSVSLSLREW